LSEATTEETRTFTDEELLARFTGTKRQPPGSQLLGFRMVRVSQADREVEVAFEASEQLTNPMKQIQGGYLCAMLDALPGSIRGIGRVVRWGKTIAFTEGELLDDQGRTLARATGTAMPTPFTRYKG